MINWILPLFKPSFWFNAMMVPFMPWLEMTLPIALAFIGLAGVVALVYAKFGKGVEKAARKFWRAIGAAALLAGLAGGILYFFHWQRVPYLSMRALWLFWLAGFGYWAYAIWKTYFKKLPEQRIEERERAAYEKWLPRHKR